MPQRPLGGLLVGWIVAGVASWAFSAAPPVPAVPSGTAAQAKGQEAQAPLPKLQDVGSGGPYCGIYSLLACLGALGVEVDPQSLVSVDYIGSSRGSSALELVKAAEACGAYAKGFVQLTPSDLSRADVPMLLHMRSNWADRGYHHWVAFLGVEDGKAIILDAPNGVETISFAELSANWDGLALAVSTAPIGNSLVYAARCEYGLTVAVVACAVYLFRRAFQGKPRERLDRNGRDRFRRLGLQTAVLVGLAGALGIAYHTLGEIGFLTNPTAVAEVVRRYYSVDVPEWSLDEMKVAVGEKKWVIVDARRAVDFGRGAIPSAISIPVYSSLAERQQALRGVSRSSPVVVYCQSSGCRYADEVANFLKFNGYTNLALYRGGYREWEAHAAQPIGANPSGETAANERPGDAE